MWCPLCGAEYRPGFESCADCGVGLVQEPPPMEPGPSPPPGPRPGPGAFHRHCPRCGVPFREVVLGEWFETSLRCAECGVAAVEGARSLPPTEGELAYTMDELSLDERTAVTAELIDERVPYRWEDDLVLVVPPTAEALADRLVEEVSGIDPSSSEGKAQS